MAQELYELSKGWEWNTLGDILEFKTGFAFKAKQYSETGILIFRATNITKEGKISLKNCRYIPKNEEEEYGKYKLRLGDIILVMVGATTGKLGIIDSSALPSLLNQNQWRLEINHTVLSPRYTYLCMLSFMPVFLESMQGAAREFIKQKDFKLLKIPVPPLAEQERIVSRLDKLFSRIDQTIAKLQHSQAQTKALWASALDEAFNPYGNRKELPPRWHLVDLGKTCTFIRGPFGGSLKKAMFVPSGYAVYEQQHAIKDQFTSIRYFVNEEKFNEMKRFELHEGDLIMSCSGTMGKVAIAPAQIQRGIINQALLKLTMGESLLNTFLLNWMRSGGFTEALNELSSGAAIKNVASVKILKQIQIPLPPLEEQAKIVAHLDAISERTKALEAATSLQLDQLKALKSSLLDAAFRGQL
jgi:type I restriction enzyme S subunit